MSGVRKVEGPLPAAPGQATRTAIWTTRSDCGCFGEGWGGGTPCMTPTTTHSTRGSRLRQVLASRATTRPLRRVLRLQEPLVQLHHRVCVCVSLHLPTLQGVRDDAHWNATPPHHPCNPPPQGHLTTSTHTTQKATSISWKPLVTSRMVHMVTTILQHLPPNPATPP